MQSAVIEHVRRNHGMAMVTQYIHYRTATSGGLPKLVREPFDAKQRLDRHRRVE